MSVDLSALEGGASWLADALLRWAGGCLFLALAVFCIFSGASLSPSGSRVAVGLWRLFLALLVVAFTVLWVFRYVPDVFAVVGVVGVLLCAWVQLLDFGRDDADLSRRCVGSTDERQDGEC